MPLPIFKEKPKEPLSKIKSIIGVAAGKGGVGKSTVTVNLALGLKEKGYQVGIMDMDIYGPSIRRMLPEDQLPIQKEEVLFPAICKGIKMISMAYFRRDTEAAVVRAPIANGLVMQFINNVCWGELDFLLIDFPPGTGDIQLTLSQKAQLTGAIMVTTPQEVSLMDVRKASHLFRKVKIPIMGIVENMSYFQESEESQPIYLFGKGGGDKLSQEMGVPLLAKIPVDPLLSEVGDSGESIFEKDFSKQKTTSKIFIELAEQCIRFVKPAEGGVSKLYIKEIKQCDNYTFSILWNDGKEQRFRLSSLQMQCPCASCASERIIKPIQVNEKVSAKGVKNVGHYALQISFSTGCSTGIYSFDMLRRME